MSVIVIDPMDTRRVTPDDPLIINSPEATYENVIIAGGDIIANVETTVLFKRLEKQP